MVVQIIVWCSIDYFEYLSIGIFFCVLHIPNLPDLCLLIINPTNYFCCTKKTPVALWGCEPCRLPNINLTKKMIVCSTAWMQYKKKIDDSSLCFSCCTHRTKVLGMFVKLLIFPFEWKAEWKAFLFVKRELIKNVVTLYPLHEGEGFVVEDSLVAGFRWCILNFWGENMILLQVFQHATVSFKWQ